MSGVAVSGISWIGNTARRGATKSAEAAPDDSNTPIPTTPHVIASEHAWDLTLWQMQRRSRSLHVSVYSQRRLPGRNRWGDAQYVSLYRETRRPRFHRASPGPRAATFGDSHRAFIEDCDFDFDFPNDAAVEGYFGAKYCVRHCTIENTLVGNHGFRFRISSTHSYEIYQNTWTNTRYTRSNLRSQRGNWISVGESIGRSNWYRRCLFIKLENYRAVGYAVAGHGVSGGFITGSNPSDGNQLGHRSASGFDPCGWPALENIGTTGPITLFSDHSTCTVSPFYEWSNTYGVDLAHQTGGSEIGVGPNYTPRRAAGNNLRIDNVDNTKVTSTTRNFLMPSRQSPSTTIASGSNGQTLPQSTTRVASTTGFAGSRGKPLLIATSAGIQPVDAKVHRSTYIYRL